MVWLIAAKHTTLLQSKQTEEEIKTCLQFPPGHGQSNGPESPTLKVLLLFCTGGEPRPMESRGWRFFVSALQTSFFWPLAGLYQIAVKQIKRSPLRLYLSV